MDQREDRAKVGKDAWADEASGPSRARWTIAGILLGFGVAGWAGLAREQGGAGEGLGSAAQSIAVGVQDASESVRDKFAAAQNSARNLGIEQQISARLHGDKTFDADKIQVHVEAEGTAVLRGLVPDAAAKEKAVALTRDTIGVLKIVDHLAVLPKPRVILGRQATSPVKPADEAPAVAARPRPLR